MKTLSLLFVSLLFLTGPLCPVASAHYPWLLVDKPNPAPGSRVILTAGWGHHFPQDSLLKTRELAKLTILAPDGQEVAATPRSATSFASAPLVRPGVYLVAASRKPGFYTKTTEGGRRQSKQGLKNVVVCYHSRMTMKTILMVGEGEGRVDQRFGHPLEIIPQAEPAAVGVGGKLMVQVLLNNQPYQGEIQATWAGFSPDKNRFAFATATDREGRAMIPLSHPGLWLVKVDHRQPYPDPEECDQEVAVATLTFLVPGK